MPEQAIRRRFIVNGQVQGVGFRPFVYRIALARNLTGNVRNTSEGVVIEVQGPEDDVDAFGHDLVQTLPPLARIMDLRQEDVPGSPDESSFEIKASSGGHGHNVLISPDTATCPDCLRDMAAPDNRRYRYPFTNCTNCGPRYTITRSIPYDRPATSMACFPMCPDCQAEYENPLDRRFHAQPNACPVCGPKVWLTDKAGAHLAEGDAALQRLAAHLAAGDVAAIKGLGGFHLACDATNQTAVAELRKRKNRPAKPLAIMVPDLDTARRFAGISAPETMLLQGRERPICLLRKHEPCPAAPGVAPDTTHIGVMLPYTPLHHVLFEHLSSLAALPALVMTSGNMSSEPICLGNREALARLGNIADLFLLHDRDILIRTDDSVVRIHPDNGETLFMRRARGYTPSPVFLAPAPEKSDAPCVLGLGPELKCTLCLTKGDQAFPSQHIGDMENLETLGFHKEINAHLQDILQVRPRLIVRDLHPDYMTSRLAEELAQDAHARGENLPVLKLQHHYAHIHSVLAENQHAGPAVGLALDGTGYGEDGTIWGGECLFVDSKSLEHKRLAHFSPCALPGGEAAVREPWRIAQAMLWELDQREPDLENWSWGREYAQAATFLPQMLERGLNCPRTTSCGRLFDAVAALLGLTLRIDYEGQAAILLEAAQDHNETGAYPCGLLLNAEPAVLDTRSLFAACLHDHEQGESAGVVARRFHLGLIAGLADMAAHFCAREKTTHVALSGGVMQNLTLAVELPEALRMHGLTPLVHNLVPPNDACISLGQAAWGRQKLLLGG